MLDAKEEASTHVCGMQGFVVLQRNALRCPSFAQRNYISIYVMPVAAIIARRDAVARFDRRVVRWFEDTSE
jgi:hypothetical protein